MGCHPERSEGPVFSAVGESRSFASLRMTIWVYTANLRDRTLVAVPNQSCALVITAVARLARSGTSRSGRPAEARTAPTPGRADLRLTHTVEIPRARAGTTS